MCTLRPAPSLGDSQMAERNSWPERECDGLEVGTRMGLACSSKEIFFSWPSTSLLSPSVIRFVEEKAVEVIASNVSLNKKLIRVLLVLLERGRVAGTCPV